MAESMFKVGEWYEFKLTDHEGEWISTDQVAGVEGTLVMLRGQHGSGDVIINTASPRFVSATHAKAAPAPGNNRFSKFGFPPEG